MFNAKMITVEKDGSSLTALLCYFHKTDRSVRVETVGYNKRFDLQFLLGINRTLFATVIML